MQAWDALVSSSAGSANGLLALVDEVRLNGVWLELLECGSTTLMRSDAYRLLSGYRVLGNMLSRCERGQAIEEEVRTALSRREYLQSVMFALLRVVSSDAARLTAAFRALVVELPTEAHVILVEALVLVAQLGGDEDGISAVKIIDALPLEWALDGSCLILRLLRRASLSTDAGSSRIGALWLLEALLAKAVADDESFYVGDLVDALLLRKSHDEQVAQIVVRSLPADSLVETLDALATVWGSRLFLARGDLMMQQYLTAAIMEVLRRIENVRLQASGSSGCPLFVLLSTGISAYLDLSDGLSRKLGMCVASKVAQLSGQELKFDEMQQNEQSNSSASREQEPERELAGASYKIGDDSSDSELEAFDVEEEEAIQPATYLRDCLDLLRHPDTNVNAHDMHLQALTSIPHIVVSGPLDSNDMCSPLMKELVRMSNTFNMEKFDSLRGDAMLSLLVRYPALSLPACVGAIEGDVMLGCKLLCVRVLVRAAHALSGVPMDSSTTGGHDAASSAGSASSSEELTRLGTTRIKRPATLARLKQSPRFFRNSFGPVALLFFRPVASALSAAANKLLASLEQDEGEGVDSLLPAQLVLALGAFTTCAINFPAQQEMIEQSLRQATPLVRVVPLSVRRASLATCLAAIEALSFIKTQSTPTTHITPLAALSNITSATTGSSSSDFSAAINVVDWCASHVQSEADKHCRIIMTRIVKCAIEL